MSFTNLTMDCGHCPHAYVHFCQFGPKSEILKPSNWKAITIRHSGSFDPKCREVLIRLVKIRSRFPVLF